jgi:hypothetical protein
MLCIVGLSFVQRGFMVLVKKDWRSSQAESSQHKKNKPLSILHCAKMPDAEI